MGTRPAWCPDGDHVYVQRDISRTQSTLWRLDVKSGREERLGTLGPLYRLARGSASRAITRSSSRSFAKDEASCGWRRGRKRISLAGHLYFIEERRRRS